VKKGMQILYSGFLNDMTTRKVVSKIYIYPTHFENVAESRNFFSVSLKVIIVS
jgi:hypothetical protein